MRSFPFNDDFAETRLNANFNPLHSASSPSLKPFFSARMYTKPVFVFHRLTLPLLARKIRDSDKTRSEYFKPFALMASFNSSTVLGRHLPQSVSKILKIASSQLVGAAIFGNACAGSSEAVFGCASVFTVNVAIVLGFMVSNAL